MWPPIRVYGLRTLGRAQREDRYFGRYAYANGRPRRAEAGMNVEARISFAIKAEMKPVRQLAESDEPREKRERHLTAVRVARQNETDAVACS